jgi:hypothetical protein
VKLGTVVKLPVARGNQIIGKINLVENENGWVRVAGKLADGSGSFAISTNGEQSGGMIQQPKSGLAFQIEQSDESLMLNEVSLSSLKCHIPRHHTSGTRPALARTVRATVPILNSRPTAVAQLYLDFDGEIVTDPLWNGGETIDAPAYDLSAAEVTAIFNRVKEDFWPFNISVTTDPQKYYAAPVGKRMRCIITPNDIALPGSGGVAYLESFARAGGPTFSSTIPCWVFNSDVVGISEAISHELGHTFGLNHDGRTLPDGSTEEYFSGHGSGAVSWGPIMGASYNARVVQWSRGEYPLANNKEDDLAIISGTANGFGYIPDEAGNTIATSVQLPAVAGNVAANGVITAASDVDYYSFTTSGGTVTINASGGAPSPNLDVALTLLDAAGTVIVSSNPPNALNASVSSALAAGTYYVKVYPTGTGDVTTTGYSAYGSIGAYNLSGNYPATPSVTIDDVSVSEGNSGSTNATLTVSLSLATSQAVTVNYATANDTAVVDADYIATTGIMIFAPNERTKTISIPIVGDAVIESNESLFVNLSNAVNGNLTDARGVLTIVNDDFPSISINDASVNEGNGEEVNADFTVSLSEVGLQPLTVNYATSNVTAVADADYTSTAGVLTFAPGETSKTITVSILGESFIENNETFNVNLSAPLNGVVADGRGIGTIISDELPPPIVLITSPDNGQFVNSLNAIKGRVLDKGETGIKSVELVLKRNIDSKYWTGSAWGARTILSTTVAGSNWLRNAGLPAGSDLLEGKYTIAATAIDNAAGTKSTSIGFTVDKTLPITMTIATPANGVNLTGLSTIRGTVSDNEGGSGIVGVQVVLRRESDGEYWRGSTWGARVVLPATISGNTWTCTATLDPNFDPGVYLVAAYAYDRAGNMRSATSTFTLSRAQLPELTITSPGKNKSVSALPGVIGRYVDKSGTGIVSAEVVLKRNSDGKYWTGSAWGARTTLPAIASGGTFRREGGLPAGDDLVEGPYTVAATVYDNSGGSKSTSIIFSVDKTLPITLTIASPANGTTVSSLANINGTVADNDGGSGIGRLELLLKRNSDSKYWTGSNWGARTLLAVTISGTTWTCASQLPSGGNLSAGGYLVAAYAYDRANNAKTANSNFNVTANAPRGSAPGAAASNVVLSVASVESAGDIIKLTFTGSLDVKSAADVLSYEVSVNGKAVDADSVAPQSSTSVVITLREGSLNSGDKLNIAYTLRDAKGSEIKGSTSVTSR